MRRLEAVLADLLARTGAQAAGVVDGRRAAVVAEVGRTTADDVPGLVRLAVLAGQAAVPDGGLDDVVLAARRAVHVLRAVTATSYLHLRLDAAGEGLAVARRWLADPGLHEAITAELRPAASSRATATVPTPVVVPGVPRQRTPEVPDGPALAVLSPDVRARSTGALAVLALGLPRRAAAAPPSVPEVLDRAWSRDTDTLRRVLAGLRGLSGEST